MRSSITTLFTEEPPRHTAPSAVAVSLVAHVVVFFLLFLGLKHTPRMNGQSAFERYTVRLLKPIQIEDPKPRQMAKVDAPKAQASRGSSAGAPSSSQTSSAASMPAPAAASEAPKAGGAASAAASAQPQIAQLPVRSQTLIQPDAPQNVQLLDEVPVPVAVIWAPVNVPTKTIIAPPPQEITVANLKPAIIKPNREPRLADVNISAARLPSQMPIVAGTTSPVVVKGPEAAPKQVPTSRSAAVEEPAPARLISLSSLAAMGEAAIPLANQSAPGGPSVVLAPARADNSAGSGAGGAAKQGVGGSGSGASQGAGVGAVARAGVGGSGSTGSGGGSGSGGQGGSAVGGSGGGDHAATGSEAGLGAGYEGSVTRLTLPRDGQFGVVVVGSSVAEEYPEVVEIWHNRLVYTVYLHVGTGKNWILQYAVPAEIAATQGGTVTKPEAPWPYDIMRPHLAESDYTADAIMVHGFVNLAGRFERLKLVFPQGFAQAKFLMDSLMQWKFRPAKQGTSLAMVEVLLIIPAEQ